MSDAMNAVPEYRVAPTRPMYWSILREVWENRSVYMAPLIVATVFLFGFLISTFRLPGKIRAMETLPSAGKSAALVMPYSMAASMVLLTWFIVGMFYCLDALNGERRDRSILFWKSMPVSDRQTVLSKAAIPALVLPILTFIVALVTQFIMLILSTAVLVMNGINPVTLWANVPLLSMTAVMFYGLTVHVLWYAPIYGWLLLVSAWAKRTTFLWAVLPFVTFFIVERIAFGTRNGVAMLRYRLLGAMTEAFSVKVPGNTVLTRLSQLDPLRFLSTSGLWIGLIFAAVCLVAAIRLRRNREPI